MLFLLKFVFKRILSGKSLQKKLSEMSETMNISFEHQNEENNRNKEEDEQAQIVPKAEPAAERGEEFTTAYLDYNSNEKKSKKGWCIFF